MTCIVGWICPETNDVWLGGDSASVGNMAHTCSEDKVFMRETCSSDGLTVRKMLIGYTTSFRMGQLIEHKLVMPIHEKNEKTIEYLIRKFADAIRLCLKDHGWSAIDKNHEEGGVLLIAYEGRLFLMCSDFQITEHRRGFQAIGSGDEIAMGAMYGMTHLHRGGMSPSDLLFISLDAASDINPYVRPPYVLKSLSGEVMVSNGARGG